MITLTSGLALGVVVDAFQLRTVDAVRGVLGTKTAARYFQGTRLRPGDAQQFVAGVVDGLIAAGVLPRPAVKVLEESIEVGGESPVQVRKLLIQGLLVLFERWDRMVGDLRSASATVTDPGVAASPLLRLAIVELAIRGGALQYLAGYSDRRSVRTPAWAAVAPRWVGRSRSRFLRALLRLSGMRRRIRYELSESILVDEHTADGWLAETASIRPKRDHLELLAAQLAHGRPQLPPDHAAALLSVHYALAEVTDKIAPVIGRPKWADYARSLVELAYRVRLTLKEVPATSAQVRAVALQLLVSGSRAPASGLLMAAVARQELNLIWRGDLSGVTRDWATHVRRVYRYAGDHAQEVIGRTLGSDALPEIAELGAYLPVSSGSDIAETPPGWRVLRISGDKAAKAVTRLYQAESAHEGGDLSLAVANARRAVALDPTNADCHFRLGVYLAQSGSVDQGINECRIAAGFRTDWAIPRVEVGIILLDAGRPEEALAELERVAATPEFRDPHLYYHLAVALHRVERNEDALQLLMQVLASKPDYADALDLAARCAFVVGDDTRGRDLMKRAARLGQTSTYREWTAGGFRKRRK